MNPLLYNPKLNRENSPNPLLPNLFHLQSENPFFPNFHTSFVKKNNQLKKLPYSSFDRKPNSHLSNAQNISKDSKYKTNEPKDNIQKMQNSRNKINAICDINRKFQKTVWFQSNFQWNSTANRSKYTFHEQTEKTDFEKVKQRQISTSFQKSSDLELQYPEFVTKNTVESEMNIQKRIDLLKENIKKNDQKFRRYDPRLQVKKERVVMRDLGQSAKEVHYLVYDFEGQTEAVLIRKSRGKSMGNDKNRDEYGEFTKRHQKNLTAYDKIDRNNSSKMKKRT